MSVCHRALATAETLVFKNSNFPLPSSKVFIISANCFKYFLKTYVKFFNSELIFRRTEHSMGPPHTEPGASWAVGVHFVKLGFVIICL